MKVSPIQYVPGVNRPGREADYSPQSTPRLRMRGAYLHSPIRLHGVVLKHKYNFIL